MSLPAWSMMVSRCERRHFRKLPKYVLWHLAFFQEVWLVSSLDANFRMGRCGASRNLSTQEGTDLVNGFASWRLMDPIGAWLLLTELWVGLWRDCKKWHSLATHNSWKLHSSMVKWIEKSLWAASWFYSTQIMLVDCCCKLLNSLHELRAW